MLFSSASFIFLFLPCVLLFYFLVPKKCKNITLLLFSFLFYWWGTGVHFFLLLASIIINYCTGLLLGNKTTEHTRRRGVVLAIGVVCNLSLLFYFKYANFMIESVNTLFHQDTPLLNIVLPIGISFFTFQGMSYIIDVYLGKANYNKNPLQVALYISLFPQLTAGPIVKYKDIQGQIQSRTTSVELFTEGINRFCFGLSKKVLISNTLGKQTDLIWSHLGNGIDTPTAWLGLLFYTLQIYFDFSGYSDMAIGLGRMFGFHILENFNFPYISKSITEFWRRWHISLSTWFRDYLYIPLGGNRKGNLYLNLFIVFLATGLWHGASWTFIVWGLWHGLFMIIEKLIMRSQLEHFFFQRTPKLLRWLYTIVVVSFGWVLFRAPDFNGAITYFKTMFGFETLTNASYGVAYYIDPLIATTLIIGLICAAPYGKNLFKKLESKNSYLFVKMILMFLLLFFSIMYIVNGTYSPFIYFQF